MFCYYTSFMLKTYYETYAPEKAIPYAQACDDIERKFNPNLPPPEDMSLLTLLKRDMNEGVSTPFSVAKLRKLVSQMNMQRLSTRFSLLTLKQWLLLADQWHLLDQLQSMFGLQVNIAILDAPLGIYNALSVALCGIRLVLDLGTLVKHTWFPVGDENALENQLTRSERAWVEIKEHYYHLANDIIWTVVNALSNYSTYFQLAAPFTTLLLVGFTVFDIFWLNYLLIQIDADYAIKRQERLGYIHDLSPDSAYLAMELELLKQLELNAERDRTELVFYLAAACILECGFLTAFVLAPPALMPMCLLMCNVAIAMYLSGGKYGLYREKCLGLTPEYQSASQKEVNDAWYDLMGTVAKNTVMPFILYGALTLSVPAAVILTLAYIAHERGLTAAYVPKVVDYFAPNAPAPSMG